MTRRTVRVSDLVAAGDIAERLGVWPSAVSNWAKRTRMRVPFPLPLVRLSSGPVWYWPDIEAWERERWAV